MKNRALIVNIASFLKVSSNSNKKKKTVYTRNTFNARVYRICSSNDARTLRIIFSIFICEYYVFDDY